ncbi:MAG: hypothetical protein ACFB10_10610 [Salibacteraceae bacterium]
MKPSFNSKFSIEGIIRGKEKGQGLEGLLVKAYDKDKGVDDTLGTTKTDPNGRFSIAYTSEDFNDNEDTRPDIYLMVWNEHGQVIHTTESKVRYGASWAEKFELVISEELLKLPERDHLREDFGSLISINPNYFGSIPELDIDLDFPVILPKTLDTSYEELLCIGLDSNRDELEAVFEVKRSTGFRGDQCRGGSNEYVAFYIDYGDGANGAPNFVPAGAPVTIRVHDFRVAEKARPNFAARAVFTPEMREKCNQAGLVRLRAILSWDQVPTGPNYQPTWGNIVEANIQIAPERLIPPSPLPELIPFAKVATQYPQQMIELAKITEKQLTGIDLKKLSEEDRERYTLTQPLKFNAINTEALQQRASSRTRWEKLTCVGLYPEQNLLAATIEVKRTAGYNGGLCTFGSPEWVIFYIDFGQGFEYVGTTSVAVHDDVASEENPVMYAVSMVLDNLQSRLEKCSVENVVRVRGILSWRDDLTNQGPDPVIIYGNLLDRRVILPPARTENRQPRIESISLIPRVNIAQVGNLSGYAVKQNAAGNDVPGAFDRPFGGTVVAKGVVQDALAQFYRFRFRKVGNVDWLPVTNPVGAFDPVLLRAVQRLPDNEGWLSLQQFRTDRSVYPDQFMMMWNSRGIEDGLYELQLEVGDVFRQPIGQPDRLLLRIDNSAPQLLTFSNSPLRNEGVTVKTIQGQNQPCGQFEGPQEIAIYGNFSDAHFRNFALTIFGGDLDPGGVALAVDGRYDGNNPALNTSGTVGAVPDGVGVLLTRLNLCELANIACAYGIELSVSDRTIVGNTPGGYRFNSRVYRDRAFVTFNWEPTGCP